MSSTRATLLAFGAFLAGMAVPFVDRVSPTVGGMALEPLAAASTVVPVREADAGRNRTNGVVGGSITAARGDADTAQGISGDLGRGLASTPAAALRLSAQQSFALGMIETGNCDKIIGQAGEVSRYQIMPSVWKHYSDSDRYQNAEVSLSVASLHWAALRAVFQKQARRQPTDFDLYVLWNAGQGYYAGKGFDPKRLNSTIRNRAQRFVNLVEDGASGPARLPSRRLW